jgi:hypothetical protein
MFFLCSASVVVLSGCFAAVSDAATSMPAAATSTAAGRMRQYDITQFGAVGDSKTKNTEAIQKTINAANEADGGIVFVPPGIYLTGTIYLRNHVTLYLSAGATLLGSTDLADYPSNETTFRSYTDHYVHQSLIAGENLHDIAITGRGVMKGQGSDRAFSASASDRGYRRRPYIIRLVSCRNVLVEGITLRDSPMWVQHYLACDNLSIRGVTVRSRANNNNDGLDIDCCRNVRVIGCNISSGDDALCLKSTADRPCENVVISDCVLSSACNGFKLGTETNGGFKNITFSNCAMYDVNLGGITLLIVDGGTLDGVTVSNVTMNNVETPIFLRLGNRARPFKDKMSAPGVGRLRNVVISNVVATGCDRTGSSIVGLPDHLIENVTLSNIHLTCEGGAPASQIPGEVPEKPADYPEFNMFGILPAYGFYCRHVDGLTLRDVAVRFDKPDRRPALVLDDVRNLALSGLRAQGTTGTQATIAMRDVSRALISECVAPMETPAFTWIDKGCERISVIGNDLSEATRPFVFAEPSLAGCLFESANRTGRVPVAPPASTSAPAAK